MQQRYYDPLIPRFLSVDPITAYSNPARAFNRYWYANNNPYRFTDPDGRQSVGEMIDSGAEGCGVVSCTGWALMNAAWKIFGAEGVSQIADKGWSNTSGGDRASAGLEIAGVLPPVKILSESAAAAKGAFQIASEGGKHAGFLKNYADKSVPQIQRATRSIEKEIATHQAKIANPEKAILGLASLTQGSRKLSSIRSDHLISNGR